MSKNISKHPELKKDPVTIRLPKYMKRFLIKEAAKKDHWSFSTIISEALAKKFNWKEPTEKQLDKLKD